ncbi:MAG: nuclear transport factor 2 family protein [Candidatus Obscuribacterales bacterium]|nr:nuclear transport factor 2 family protein [Candidatus Obscuribacterales bacterium]
MNKSQNNRRSSYRLCKSHGAERTDKSVEFVRIWAAAMFASFVVGCFGCYVIKPAEADTVETEPIVNVVKPYASPESESTRAESQNVIDVLQIMGKAYASGDIAEYIKHLDNECSVFDEHKNKMVEGKEAVIAALKQKFDKHSKAGSEHILSYTIDQPYVKVDGKTAVVTYRVIEEVGGTHPRKLEGSMSDVFEKEDGHWMKVYQQAVWKRVK